ncbi:tRNA (guanine-N(7)-)-methyltransferase [Aureimonas sp. SA4125]|uniref:tRNA (guanine(46)-N(7))-methyltransferase TrmB n=1 Tax=Aureimonas sp. SA4125 TaxID=2826993 RepID=UPI001CC508C3|nr:tRNA (guanosine(46)-N(7))-methyltransferase TrmB [Aureimonas sp. SA4125]BDA87080.1 tRNA (guanine-N(7)-)-methyltransferase [Aureimonas sp. SA4125]
MRPARLREAFYGRLHGKTLRPGQASTLRTLLPQLSLDLAQPAPADIRQLFPGPIDAVRLEIGFGGGEHLLSMLGRHPRSGFLGAEPFVNGMAKMLAALEAEPSDRIRLFSDDATLLLDWLPDGSLGGIDLLYPDPWPKPRHWKRRFVSAANLDRFARVLAPGSLFRFASDIDSYVAWTLKHCAAHAAFDELAPSPADRLIPYEGWPGTRYEAKALREGRQPRYLVFRRLPHAAG